MDPFMTRENLQFLYSRVASQTGSPPDVTSVSNAMHRVISDVGSSAPTDRRRRLDFLNRVALDSLVVDTRGACVHHTRGAIRDDERIVVINSADRDWSSSQPNPYDFSVKLDGTENTRLALDDSIRQCLDITPLKLLVPGEAPAGIFDSAFVVLKTDARSTNELMSTRSSLNGAHVVLCNDDGHYNSASSYHHFDNLSGMTLRAGDSTQARLTSLRMNLVTSDGVPVVPDTLAEGCVYTFAEGHLKGDVIHIATDNDDAPVDTTEYRVRYTASSVANEKNVRGSNIKFHATTTTGDYTNAVSGAVALTNIAIRRRYGPHLVLRVRMQV